MSITRGGLRFHAFSVPPEYLAKKSSALSDSSSTVPSAIASPNLHPRDVSPPPVISPPPELDVMVEMNMAPTSVTSEFLAHGHVRKWVLSFQFALSDNSSNTNPVNKTPVVTSPPLSPRITKPGEESSLVAAYARYRFGGLPPR